MVKEVVRAFALFGAVAVLSVILTACEQSKKKAPPELEQKKPPAAAKVNTGAEGASEAENIFINVAESVTPSVVNISTFITGGEDEDQSSDLGSLPQDEYHNNVKPRQQYSDRSVGSGVIISDDGYIITNAHVVLDASDITVKLSDKREFTASLIGLDVKTDIAVLKIDANETLHPAKLGDSSNLKIGQWAIAIGNPFGLDRTVTVGVVSGVGREDVGVAQYESFIQTDASINPGNSGGPLLNSSGEVIGINTAIMSAGQGISFAIPIDMVKDIAKKLIEKGEVVRGWLGVGIQNVTQELADGLGLKADNGVLVNKIFDGSPAKKSGIKVGDVILEYDHLPITGARQLQSVVAATEVGKNVEVDLLRGGKPMKLAVKIKEMDETGGQDKETKTELANSPELGLTVHPVSAATGYTGVVVVEVEVGSNAEKAGIGVGDVITSINLKPIKNVTDFKTEVGKLGRGDMAVLLIMRARSPLFIAYRAK